MTNHRNTARFGNQAIDLVNFLTFDRALGTAGAMNRGPPPAS
jgi:hypothetical protein